MQLPKDNIIGVDEAGRGPLAGPVFAGAVLIEEAPSFVEEIKDSKKISESKREDLFDKIMDSEGLIVGASSSSSDLIDNINILEATKRTMEEAIQKIKISNTLIIIDGNFRLSLSERQRSIIQADERVLECSIASIVAKVSRDRYMRKMDEKFPQYNFKSHKGYPTKAHKKAVQKHGPCPIHRKSFKLS